MPATSFVAELVIAKHDRLSRYAHFLLSVEALSVVVATDMPNAHWLATGIIAIVTDKEPCAIFARIKAALGKLTCRLQEAID